ncbi:MAG: hypothetical protein K8R56_03220 [Candidatus Eisenbacteria bacterium]|nr:hypothetical protein [Candidatus Eisenbacteria bacterium]
MQGAIVSSCPVGFIRVVQMHGFRVTAPGAKGVFEDSSARRLPEGWKPFRGSSLRRRLARMAGLPVDEVEGVWAAQVFVGESAYEQCFKDSSGNGFSLRVRDDGSKLTGHLCVPAKERRRQVAAFRAGVSEVAAATGLMIEPSDAQECTDCRPSH